MIQFAFFVHYSAVKVQNNDGGSALESMENNFNPTGRRALLAGLKPVEKFLFTVVIMFILGLIFQFLGAFLAAWIYGYGFSEILSLGAFDDPRYVAASK